jgi:hypothetical protein
MNRTLLVLLLAISLVMSGCDRDDEEDVSERFLLLTGTVWVSDQLLINGEDASQGLLANFQGEAIFEPDGTGSFGQYTGTWEFLNNETNLRILPQGFLPIIAEIVTLTQETLEIVTGFPNPENPSQTWEVRMKFSAN